MRSEIKYLFCIVYDDEARTFVIKIVPHDFWVKNHRQYDGYIPDSCMAKTIEKLGYPECIENSFELPHNFNADNVKSEITALGNIEYSEEFEKYCTEE